MGPSRKHIKEKDRGKVRESTASSLSSSRKRHHRSRSRERDNVRYSSSSSRRDVRDKRQRSRDRDSPPDKRIRDEFRNDDDEPVRSKGSGGDVSLSIQETNKLRLKLGLKPLDVKDGSSSGAKSEGGEKELDFVHKPAEDLTNKRFLETLREKVAVQRQKRQITEKLSKVKTLADSDSEDDASVWVTRSRQIEEEKRKAEERAKLLAEMDEEFGIGNLVEDEFKQIKAQAYSSKDLFGLKVEHSESSFEEGKLTILTLQDKGVLDDKEDTLINVNMLDNERAAKNIEIRKKKPTYNPYDNEQVDDFGQLQNKNLLAKYDEEIEGEKRKSFMLGAAGKFRRDTERDMIRQKLMQKQGVVSLEMPAPKVANEYYTDEELVKFKKPTKKVRKVRRKVKVLKADDLLQMSAATSDSQTLGADLGSRSTKKRRLDLTEQFKHPWETEESADGAEDMDVDKRHPDDDHEILGPDEDLSGTVVDADEAGLELQLALSKARRLRHGEDRKPSLDSMVKNIQEYRDIYSDDQAGAGKGSIVLNSTAEFCRALGDIPTYGMSGNRDEDVEDLRDYDEELYGDGRIKEEPEDADEDASRGAWNEVEMVSPTVKVKKEEVTILDEEPDVGTGIAGALQLAMKKGYLEKEVKKQVSAPRHSTLEATSYTIEDKNMLEDDRLGRRERYSAGPVTDFRDKDGYKPDIKLEYIDDGGRLLTPKEAFRYLSHKFHGKGSGKNKTEKRMKKLQEESLMKRMSSTDTPLGTLALLQDKQKQTQSPYIVLSGGSKAINSSVISKTK